MLLLRSLSIAFVLAASLGTSSLAFADVPPTCAEFDNDVTCSASDVGKPCSGGGTCYQVYCSSQSAGGGTSQNLYKCETCPTLLDADAASACSGPGGGTSYGSPCAGGAGTCEKLPEYCPAPNTTTYLWCVENGTGTMHGVPTGDGGGGSKGGSSSGGGCTMTPDASRGWFTAALGLVGVAALGLGRQRRRR